MASWAIALGDLATGVEWVSQASGYISLGTNRQVYVYLRNADGSQGAEADVYQDAGLTTLLTQPLTAGATTGALPGFVLSGQSLLFVDVASGLSVQADALAAAASSGAAVSSPDGTISVSGGAAIDVVYGTSANTAAEGNDSRIAAALKVSGSLTAGNLLQSDGSAAQDSGVATSSVVSVTSGGESPGDLGWGTLPDQADYHLRVVDSGIGAVNVKTGNTDYSVSSGDHGAIINEVFTALRGQTVGGMATLNGWAQCSTQILLTPGQRLVGQGPLCAQPSQQTAAGIQSTYDGSVILLQGDSDGDTFVEVADLVIRGDLTLTSQNGIELNDAAGDLKDATLRSVLIFQMGQHGLYVNSACKLWADVLYLESCVGDGLHAVAASISLDQTYIFGNTGNGIYAEPVSSLAVSNSKVWSNAQSSDTAYGLDLQGATRAQLTGVDFADNGGSGKDQCRFGDSSATTVAMANCPFSDSRGSGAVNRHIAFTSSHAITGSLVGCSFSGQKSTALFVGAVAGTHLTIADCPGFNDTYGQAATPFTSTGPYIGIMGGSAAPTSSTTYTVQGTGLMLSVSGGTAVSITIKDPAGNTVQSGLSNFTGILPVGYSINFGAFSVAPTVYAGVV